MDNISGAYPITRNETQVGAVTISEKGLTTVFEAASDFYGDGVYKLFAASESSVSPVGVMMPRDGGLTMTRSFTKAALSALNITPDTRFFLAKSGELPLPAPNPQPHEEHVAPPDPPLPSGGWSPIKDPSVLFSDPDIATACKSARGTLVKTADSATLLAVPVKNDEPFPMMPVFCFGEPETIDGGEYLIFNIKNGALSL